MAAIGEHNFSREQNFSIKSMIQFGYTLQKPNAFDPQVSSYYTSVLVSANTTLESLNQRRLSLVDPTKENQEGVGGDR